MAAGRSPAQVVARLALGGFLVFAGVGHLSSQREDFRAQVPDWVPLDPDLVVVASGVVEIALGAALILLARYRVSTIRKAPGTPAR